MEEINHSLEEYLLKGFVLFSKNDIIELEKAPRYGELTLFFQDGKMTHLVKKETKK